jgi:hypothetical protein
MTDAILFFCDLETTKGLRVQATLWATGTTQTTQIERLSNFLRRSQSSLVRRTGTSSYSETSRQFLVILGRTGTHTVFFDLFESVFSNRKFFLLVLSPSHIDMLFFSSLSHSTRSQSLLGHNGRDIIIDQRLSSSLIVLTCFSRP